MRSLIRTVIAAALAVLAVLVPAVAASAKQPTPAKWAKQHHFKGHWRTQDADKDGLGNQREFKLKTDPRRADTDRDGLKDGDELAAGDDPLAADTNGDGTKDGGEHAGVVVSFDGTTLVLRQFHGPRLAATVDPDVDCYAAGSYDDDSISDNDSTGDDDLDDTAADTSSDEDVIDLTGDDDSDEEDESCAAAGVQAGAVVRSLSVDRDGDALVVYSIELAA